MSRLYCLCHLQDSQHPFAQRSGAPNRWAPPPLGHPDAFPRLLLLSPMPCFKTGASQLSPNDPSLPRFPNVDVYECPNCHARIAHEAL